MEAKFKYNQAQISLISLHLSTGSTKLPISVLYNQEKFTFKTADVVNIKRLLNYPLNHHKKYYTKLVISPIMLQASLSY